MLLDSKLLVIYAHKQVAFTFALQEKSVHRCKGVPLQLHREEEELLLLLFLPVEHHLCIGNLSSERNHGKHGKRRTKKNLVKLKMFC